MKEQREIESSELPFEFDVWCDCGWKGRIFTGFMYVIGESVPINPSPTDKTKCPTCKKNLHKYLNEKALAGRFLWAIANVQFKYYKEGSISFPCKCDPQPASRMTGTKLELAFSSIGNDTFVTDEQWYRMAAPVECTICGASGKISMLEKMSYKDGQNVEWIKNYNPYNHKPYIVKNVNAELVNG